MTTPTSPSHFPLFGHTTPFLPPPWTITDDRVRGGSSHSYLTALPSNCAHFHGHLDTSTLGGAGFASQFSPTNDDGARGWDLSAYDGIEITVGNGDGKVYTFILKDEEAGDKREDGREKAGVNWEVEFQAGKEVTDDDDSKEQNSIAREEGKNIWIPWTEFKATYRGKEKPDAGPLKTKETKRIGLMMRSYFGKQSGDFSLELKSITARKQTAEEQGQGTSKLTQVARWNFLPHGKEGKRTSQIMMQ